ncbi:MAG: U32 family peptidase [Selenomonadaceae bacterium]|nr:U32 family peptidase [Selenomonadaceae bacterium]
MTELLAPAGSFDALKAAVEAGANAVYLAGESFGARAYAENFSRENLIRAVEFAHLRNVSVHVTTNTILSDEEIENFADYVKFLRRANVDALLVQDLGAAKIIKNIAPEIPLHASTQMTVHNLDGVLMLADLAFSRAVLSRELSLTEIENISKNSPIETEIFIHGALCVCYSGQCLMSSLIGARSGNRGKCAQPCRLPYTLVDGDGKEILKTAGEYLLSPKDLNTLKLLPKIISAGVTSLKIEGRMKRPEYVATVVKIYRDAIDKNFSTDEDNKKLAQIFNRDFTTAYLEKNPGKNLISDKRPNNRGILIGRIFSVDKNKITLKLSEKISAGDQIEIWVKVGGRKTFTVENFSLEKDFCTIEVDDTRGIKISDRVFKIFDAELTAEARKFFTSESPVKKFPVTAEVKIKLGKPMILTMTDDEKNSVTAETNFIAETAKKRPLTEETLQKQIGRLGSTIFELEKINFDVEENLMVPISEINDVRRKVTSELENLRLKKFERKISDSKFTAENYKIARAENILISQVDTLEKLKISLDNGADAILYGGENFCHRNITEKEILQAEKITHDSGKKFYLSTPRIVRENEIDGLKKFLTLENLDAVYVHNLGTLRLAKNFCNAPIHTDFSLITFNNSTINFLKNLGVEGVTLSPELTLTQIKNLAKKSCLPLECIVHGKTELMISSYCVPGSFLGEIDKKNCPQICRQKNFYLRDRKNILFPIATDQFCRMHILNSKTLSMIENRKEFEDVANIRVDCRALDLEETKKIIRAYKFGGEEIENFTRGHYFRGV